MKSKSKKKTPRRVFGGLGDSEEEEREPCGPSILDSVTDFFDAVYKSGKNFETLPPDTEITQKTKIKSEFSSDPENNNKYGDRVTEIEVSNDQKMTTDQLGVEKTLKNLLNSKASPNNVKTDTYTINEVIDASDFVPPEAETVKGGKKKKKRSSSSSSRKKKAPRKKKKSRKKIH